MRRALLVVLVAVLLLIAGCAEGGETADETPAAETGDDLEDADPDTEDGPETAETPSDSNGSEETEANGTDSGDENGETTDVDGELEIHHIDVGQADATLLIDPSGETMLVDSGDWPQAGADVIEYLEAQDVDRIDHLVATHAHADHIGGHDEIIAHYETERDGIGAAYDSGVATTSQTYERYLDAVEEHDVDLFVVDEDDRFEFGAADVDVLNPPSGDSGSDLHYNSVTLRVEFGEFAYLTTGDAEAEAEQRMVDEHGDRLDVDVYQAGHHGSSTSSSQPFMDRVTPAVAIISSAYDSQYGHPSDDVLEEYADRGLETYWTGVHGDVVLTTNGEGYDVETEREAPTDAGALLGEKPTDDSDAQEAVIQPIRPTVLPVAD
ncbi:ComEC/Rec2 family competence protein [Natronococcus occultus]|uniref:Putative hydrolase (Metallo-beta-lactamase superfamily) n=1 Tax=Natronococcus occultus SP4 TaxID=694430 RepID=L0K6F2_9EURY|nr:ComEC/Rec2 family competence protein [Natronococcus occultus]AGB39939.1 putative hydrolase (metallo-beta-lactamase superfamily) [Natronococcus occultus SP4]